MSAKANRFDNLASRTAKPGAVAGVLPAKPVTAASDVDERVSRALDMQSRGGLLEIAGRYTAQSAIEHKLPLQRFKRSDLVVHHYNVRPASGESDLAELTEQLRTQGQLDPIHVVPHKGGFAIMEGQRRWLAAPAAGLDELDAWVHPEPEDPFEIYAFGQMIHESRKDTTAFDQAVVWGRMISDGLFVTPSELAKRAEVDDSTVSARLKILKAGAQVLAEIRSAPARFTHRHLYAIAQIADSGGEDAATDAARSVVLASGDSPVSARKLEALAAAFVQSGHAPTRGRRKNSVPMSIRSPSGEVMGAMKSYRDGRLEFKPAKPLPEAVAERIADAVKAVFASELQLHIAQAGQGG